MSDMRALDDFGDVGRALGETSTRKSEVEALDESGAEVDDQQDPNDGDEKLHEPKAAEDDSEDESEDDSEEDSEEDSNAGDPVPASDRLVDEFNFFVVEKEANRKVYIFEIIGRKNVDGEGFTGRSAPTEMRIKPKSGFIEVDIPLDIHSKYYDKKKGIMYGEALRKTKDWGQEGYGAAYGYRRVWPRSKKRPRADGDDDDDDGDDDDDDDEDDFLNADERAALDAATDEANMEKYLKNFDDANEKGHVLNTITWSGAIEEPGPTDPPYMVGVFRGRDLYFTPVDNFVRLQPNDRHRDALAHIKEAREHREPRNAKSVAADKQPPETETEKFMRETAEEPWLRYTFNTSDSEQSAEGRARYFVDAKQANVLEFEDPVSYLDRILPRVVGDGKKIAGLDDCESENEEDWETEEDSVIDETGLPVVAEASKNTASHSRCFMRGKGYRAKGFPAFELPIRNKN